MFTPANSFLRFVVFASLPVLVKIHQEMRAWECTQTYTRAYLQVFWGPLC